MLALDSSYSIVNLHPDLISTTVRKYFPHNCPACPDGQLAQQSSASVNNIPYTLPDQAIAIDFKVPGTAADGTPARSLTSNLYTFTALDFVTDYA